MPEPREKDPLLERMSSTAPSKEFLRAEHRSLIDAIVACSSSEGVKNNTIRAVGHYLFVHGNQIPWFRMYSEYPQWQQSSGLLNKDLDKDIVLQGRPTVFYTLINPHSRKDLRVGSWHSRGKETCNNKFVLTKLYYTGDPNRTKENGITLLEFVLKMDHKPHVAICVLHRQDYRHLIRDLKQGTDQQNLPGNQANLVDVPQRQAPVNIAPAGAGFMNSPQVSYINIESVGYGPTRENYSMNQYNSAFPTNLAMYNRMPGNIEATNVGYHHSPQISNLNPLNTLLNNGSMNAGMPLGNIGMSSRCPSDPSNFVQDPSNNWPMNHVMLDIPLNVRNHPFPENYTINPSNTFPNNASMYGATSLENIDMILEHHPDSSSYGMNPSNPWTMNNGMHGLLMASDNGQVLPTISPPGSHLVTTEQNNNGDEISQLLYFSGTQSNN